MSVISSDVIRGYNDTMILYLLRQSSSYGYEISRQIRQMTEGKYIIKETTLYSAFTRMEKNGYIVSYPMEAPLDNAKTGSTQLLDPAAVLPKGSGKRRTYYRITERGEQYYREKCDEWRLTQEVVEHFIAEGGR